MCSNCYLGSNKIYLQAPTTLLTACTHIHINNANHHGNAQDNQAGDAFAFVLLHNPYKQANQWNNKYQPENK